MAKDSRDPTHVYLDIMAAKTGWNEGILAAADRVENDRRAGAERPVLTTGAPSAPPVSPRDWADYGPFENGGKAPRERTGEPVESNNCTRPRSYNRGMLWGKARRREYSLLGAP